MDFSALVPDFSALFPARRAWKRDFEEAVRVGDTSRADMKAAAEGDHEAQVLIAVTVEVYREMREMVRSGEAVRLPDGRYVSQERVADAPPQ